MATLRDLGLSEYEARVYRALLTTGPTTAKELSRRSDVPKGRIYDVLDALESAEMVRSQESTRPKRYAAVGPEAALSRLMDEKRREVTEELDRFEDAIDDVVDRLEAREPPDGEFYTVAIGPEESVELLTDRLSTATERVDYIVADISGQFDIGALGARVAEEIEDALERGVSVSALATPETVDVAPDALNERIAVLLEHPEYDARLLDGLSGSVYLVDQTEVCMTISNPLDPKEPLALIALRSPPLVRSLRDEFEPRWERAEPLAPILAERYPNAV